jgi:sorbitol/mannitol transport system permease protein
VFTSFKTDQDAVKPEFLFSFTPTLENYTNMTAQLRLLCFAINSADHLILRDTVSLIVVFAYAMAFDPPPPKISHVMLSTQDAACRAAVLLSTFLTKNFKILTPLLVICLSTNRPS